MPKSDIQGNVSHESLPNVQLLFIKVVISVLHEVYAPMSLLICILDDLIVLTTNIRRYGASFVVSGNPAQHIDIQQIYAISSYLVNKEIRDRNLAASTSLSNKPR